MAESPVSRELNELAELAKTTAATLSEEIAQAGDLVAETLSQGGKVLVCGNGGSAADAQHFAAELVGRYMRDRRGLPGISLSVDPSVVTAISNDFGFDHVFARQVEAHGKSGDLLIVISTSGRSRNLVMALERASQMGIRTVALVANSPAQEFETCDVCIQVPSENTQRIQEIHTAILHAICARVDKMP